MSSHRGFTRLFPRSWRARYGRELADLIEDMKGDERGFHLRDGLDLARAGLCERGAGLSSRSAHGRSRVFAATSALVVALGSALLIGGVFGGPPLPARAPLAIAASSASRVPLSVLPAARLKVDKITSLAVVTRPTMMRVVSVKRLAEPPVCRIAGPVTTRKVAKRGEVVSVTPPGPVPVSRSSGAQITVGSPKRVKT